MAPPNEEGGGPPAGGGGNNSNGKNLLVFCLVLALVSLVDMKTGSSPSNGVQASKEVPTPKFSTMMAGPSIKFLYWYEKDSRLE